MLGWSSTEAWGRYYCVISFQRRMSNNNSYLPVPTKRDDGRAGESGTGNHGSGESRASNTGTSERSVGSAGSGTGSGSSRNAPRGGAGNITGSFILAQAKASAIRPTSKRPVAAAPATVLATPKTWLAVVVQGPQAALPNSAV